MIDDLYMGLGVGQKAEEEFIKLKKRCEDVDGFFSLLWHNSNLANKSLDILYRQLLL